MASPLKTVLIVLGSLAFAGFAAFVALIAWAIHRDDAAKAQADALCAPSAIGASMDAVQQRARAAGSATSEPRWMEVEEGNAQMLVVFPAGLPMSGYLCTLSARDGVVTGAEVTMLD
jgi:hypothetical protein